MNIRKLSLRVMLWSLAAGAASGAGAMLLFEAEVIWRVVGTAITTAVAAGLMMALSMMADREKARDAALLGMGAVVSQFLLVLALIWLPRWAVDDDHLALTVLWIFLVTPPAMMFLRLGKQPNARRASLVGLALAGAVLLLLLIATWAFDYGYPWWGIREDLSGTAGIIAAYGFLCCAALAGIETQRYWWRWAGVGASILAAGIAITAIWLDLNDRNGVFETITSIAVLVAICNLLMFVPLLPNQKWLRTATILAAAACAGFIDLIALLKTSGTYDDDIFARLAGASGILAACGCLALAVLARLNLRLDRRPVLSEIRQCTIICPGCGKKHVADTGASACPTCGLIAHVKFEEPRCPNCDYLLFMLQSERCPECGTPVKGEGAARLIAGDPQQQS